VRGVRSLSSDANAPFWERKPLSEFDRDE
jgi:hypothetical protein